MPRLSLGALAAPAERWVGTEISRQVCNHHHRRLRKLGWERALDPPAGGWVETGYPRRAGNSVEVVIDGAEALPAIADEMRRARSHVHVAGWYFTPSFSLIRDGDPVVLFHLLAEIAERVDVRVLTWAGSPLPLFRPSRADVRKMRDRLVTGSKVRVALDSRERPLHCHHEKLVIIDNRIAFVGGIDLTSEAGDRFDSSHHPARGAPGWHDVAARIAGPAVADIAEHFNMRWHETTGERLEQGAVPASEGTVELQVVRTVPEKLYAATRRGEFGILESYVRAFRAAQRFIYLENQFLWSPEIAAVLAERIAHPPSPDFRVLVLLPAKPNSGVDDTRGVLGELIEADADRGHLVGATIFARSGTRADAIYVHAKVGIIDDAWLTVGSANLNEHSLFNDTEMNIVSHDAALARRTRLRLWSEHLELPIEKIDHDPVEVIDTMWKPISKEQLARRDAGEPLTHRLVRLPNVSKRSSRLFGPLTGLVVDG